MTGQAPSPTSWPLRSVGVAAVAGSDKRAGKGSCRLRTVRSAPRLPGMAFPHRQVISSDPSGPTHCQAPDIEAASDEGRERGEGGGKGGGGSSVEPVVAADGNRASQVLAFRESQ
jgi:hypothetical protein